MNPRNFEFKSKNITFKGKFEKRLNIIGYNSAEGKSFLLRKYADHLTLNGVGCVYISYQNFNMDGYNLDEFFKSIPKASKIVFVDNGDIFLTTNIIKYLYENCDLLVLVLRDLSIIPFDIPDEDIGYSYVKFKNNIIEVSS